jgi:hypothetical protein
MRPTRAARSVVDDNIRARQKLVTFPGFGFGVKERLLA